MSANDHADVDWLGGQPGDLQDGPAAGWKAPPGAGGVLERGVDTRTRGGDGRRSRRCLEGPAVTTRFASVAYGRHRRFP